MNNHSINHDAWKSMSDILSLLDEKLGEFEQKYPGELYQLHFRNRDNATTTPKPLGDVYESLEEGLQFAHQNMPEEPVEDSEAEYQANFKCKQEREESHGRS